ncbi:MAG: tyrosine-type recombinase/integrase [Pseudomonadales bacterium]
MGRSSENRIKFSKPNLSALERRINTGGFSEGAYIYDSSSHLALRIRPNQSFTDCGFYLYERVKVLSETSGRSYKRHLMKVGEARNTGVSVSELRKKADTLFLEIQARRDPQMLARQETVKQVAEQQLIQAKRSFRDMIYGSPGDDDLLNDFIAERRPSERYLNDIKNKCGGLLGDLLDEPLHAITAEQVKTVYLKQVGKGQTQLHNAMRILRSVWNWAQAKYDESDLFLRNPVTRAMKQLGVNINRTNRCTDRLDDTDFKLYLRAVLSLRANDHTSGFRNGRDALLFMLFSGVRITGTVTINVDDIDLNKKTFKITKKGGERVELPLNSVTEAIIRNRLPHLPNDTQYLFPGIAGRGYYQDTSAVRKIVKETSGVSVTNHDLRRTYKTIGTELDINKVLVDELLSHAREGVDAHYIHPSMTKLRESSQKIADYVVNKAGFNLIKNLEAIW